MPAKHQNVAKFSSVAQSCQTLCDPMNNSMQGFTVHHELLESTQTHGHWVGDAIQPSHLLSSPSPPVLSIRVFSNESALRIGWPKYWSFSFSIHPSHVYSGLISLRMDWFDLLVVQGTLNSLLQGHSLKASVSQWSDVFMVTLSHPYMTTGKAIALILWTFVISHVSVFNIPSKSAIAFHPRRKLIF